MTIDLYLNVSEIGHEDTTSVANKDSTTELAHPWDKRVNFHYYVWTVPWRWRSYNYHFSCAPHGNAYKTYISREILGDQCRALSYCKTGVVLLLMVWNPNIKQFDSNMYVFQSDWRGIFKFISKTSIKLSGVACWFHHNVILTVESFLPAIRPCWLKYIYASARNTLHEMMLFVKADTPHIRRVKHNLP